MSRSQLLYAATDAYAGHLVWAVLEKQKVITLEPLGQTMPASTIVKDGAPRAEMGGAAGDSGVGAKDNDGPGESHLDDDLPQGRTDGAVDLSSDVLADIEPGVPAAAWLVGERCA